MVFPNSSMYSTKITKVLSCPLSLEPVDLTVTVNLLAHHTVHYILHTTYCTLHTAHYILHTSYCTINTTRCTLHTTHYILHSAHYTLLVAHCTLHSAH